MAESLRFFVEVSADQATQALKAITTSLNQADVAFKTKMQGIGAASRGAGAEVISLGDKMKAFAREQRQEARTANFFVQELASVIPMSNGIKGAIGGIGAAIVGGAGLASAIQLATVGIGYLVERSRQAAAEVEAFAKQSGAAIDDLDKRIDGLRTKTGAGKALEEWRLLRMQVDERRALVEVLRGQIAAEEALPASLSNDVLIDQNKAKIAQAEAEIFQLDRRSAKLQEIVRLELGNADAAKAIADAERDAAKATAARAQAAERAAQREIDVANAYFEAAYARDEAARALDARNADVGSVAAFNSLEAGGYDPAAVAKAATAGQRSYNAEVQQSIALQQQWGSAIGNVLGAVVTGQATVGQALAQIGQMVIQSVVQSAIASIQADAARAAAGAAASQAGVPVVGPVLAISAMGAMMSAVLGLMGTMPSAAGGWRVPSSINPVTQLHGGEHVIPRDIAQRYEQGSPGGGIVVNVGGSIVSERDLYTTLTARDGALAKAQRKMERRRRS